MSQRDPLQLREGWILCFALGVVMLNFPFLEIFNKGADFFGIPVLILYLFIGWPVSIFVVFLFSRHLDGDSPPSGDDKGEG